MARYVNVDALAKRIDEDIALYKAGVEQQKAEGKKPIVTAGYAVGARCARSFAYQLAESEEDLIPKKKVLQYIADVQLGLAPDTYKGAEKEAHEFAYQVLDWVFEFVKDN